MTGHARLISRARAYLRDAGDSLAQGPRARSQGVLWYGTGAGGSAAGAAWGVAGFDVGEGTGASDDAVID